MQGNEFVCAFNAGSFDSLNDNAAIDLKQAISAIDENSQTLMWNIDSFIYSTIAVDDECFDAEVIDGELIIDYKASCQACHSIQIIDVSHPGWVHHKLRVSFDIDCSSVNTLFLGNQVGASVKQAIDSYAWAAKNRGEKVKLIDYSSGFALKDQARPIFQNDNCDLGENAESFEIKNECVAYLRERVLSDNAALILLGDDNYKGVPAYTAYDPEGTLLTLNDRIYDPYYYANRDSPSYQASQALIVSRLPGDSSLIINLLERGSEETSPQVLVITQLGDSEPTRAYAEREGAQLPAQGEVIYAPSYCYPLFGGNECDYEGLQLKLAGTQTAYFITHGSGESFTALSQNDELVTIINSLNTPNPPELVLSAACYSASTDKDMNGYSLLGNADRSLARTLLRGGTANILGYNRGHSIGESVHIEAVSLAYSKAVNQGLTLGEAVRELSLSGLERAHKEQCTAQGFFDCEGSFATHANTYKLHLYHLNLLGLPNSRVTP